MFSHNDLAALPIFWRSSLSPSPKWSDYILTSADTYSTGLHVCGNYIIWCHARANEKQDTKQTIIKPISSWQIEGVDWLIHVSWRWMKQTPLKHSSPLDYMMPHPRTQYSPVINMRTSKLNYCVIHYICAFNQNILHLWNSTTGRPL
jgi:hypothetical protein